MRNSDLKKNKLGILIIFLDIKNNIIVFLSWLWVLDNFWL